MELRGEVAVVTGGFGQRICHALAREGVHIAVVYARSRDQAEGVARELADRHQIQATAPPCDLEDPEAAEVLVAEVIARFGRLDISVNDAAYNIAIPFQDLETLTDAVWEKVMAVNLSGPIRLTRAVAPVMKSQDAARVVNIASVAGLGPTGSPIPYAVSRELIHLTRYMAVAMAPDALVNCVAPSLVERRPC